MMLKMPTSTKDSLPNKAMNDLPRLASAVLPLCSQHPGLCGILPLDKSLDAFAARYRLAELAEHTLDVQYYIWQDDMSGPGSESTEMSPSIMLINFSQIASPSPVPWKLR